ncbi:MAG: diaminopimelate decarboxylase, partial [Acidobacteriaceae bacterium]|nr:diaminopimelate decarboxylase [Acidobacteriaceae bacterium]
NSTLAILRLLARAGLGFDIVSGGELFRVLAAGADPASVVFSGVGKTADEIRFALQQGIGSFNCESETEIEWISRIASELAMTAAISIRVNPDVSAITHPYISTGLREHKFGVDIRQAEEIYIRACKLPGIRIEGVSCHIGSQLLDPDPLLEAAGKVLTLVTRLRGVGLPIRFLDLGGGLGVSYRPGERAVSIGEFVSRLQSQIQPLEDLTLLLEPGRSIVAESGILLTRVLLVKNNGAKPFVIVDAGMNDLIRPSLYQAHHEIVPVQQSSSGERFQADVVGPVCETGDFFARGRDLPLFKEGDLVAIRTAGAYGFVQSSNYNSRPRACELLVDGETVHVARRREQYEDLIRGESV